MKKSGNLTISFIYIAAAIIMAAACNNDLESGQSRESIVIKASIDNGDTKTQLENQGVVSWTENDLISVFQGLGKNEQYRFQGETGDYSGVFTKDDTTDPGQGFSTIYSIYPYSIQNECSSEGVFSVSFPSHQTYAPGSFAPGASLMVAYGSLPNRADLRFRSACSYLRIRCYCPSDSRVRSIVVKGNNNEIVAGSAECTISDGIPVLSINGTTEKEITLSCPDVEIAKSAETATEFWIVVPPMNFPNGFTVSVIDSDGNEFVKKTTKNVSFTRNVVKTMAAFQFAPTIAVINGTPILKGNNLVGLITDANTSMGIPGIPVTDGYKYTYTDANGVYQMVGHSDCQRVYYSKPSNYKTTLDASHLPVFHSTSKPDLSIVNRNDFVLTPQDKDETNFTLVGIGDPQPNRGTKASNYINETIPDIHLTLDSGGYENVYALTAGDVTYNDDDMWPYIKQSMSNFQLTSGEYVPFYQCPGNHDFNGGGNEIAASRRFIDTFGPMNYSFNIGKAHIIVMKDVLLQGSSTGNWSYRGGLTDAQWSWLQEDLNTVQNKEDKLVIFDVHIPFHNYHSGTVYFKDHYDDVLSALTAFHEAHIFAGHTHTHYNLVHMDYVTASGLPIYEHIQGTACGSWWTSYLASDGAPAGYTVCSIRGNTMYDWLQKGTHFDASYQMRVYDGNQTYQDNYSHTLYWYHANNPVGPGSDNSRGDAVLENSFVVNLWSGDDVYWTLELFQDGKKVGDFIKVPNQLAWDSLVASFYYRGVCNIYITQYDHNPFPHYWYIKTPHGGSAAAESNWEVRATQTIPGSGVSHVYSCTTLTTDYTGFKK